MKVLPAIAKKNMHYSLTRFNSGKAKFAPGERVFVAANDFPKMQRQGQVDSVEGYAAAIIEQQYEIDDIFPIRGKKIWVFGDGPTAPQAKKLIGEHDIVFGVNRCFYTDSNRKNNALGIIPTYYVALDRETIEKNKDEIHMLPSVRKFTRRGNENIEKYGWPDMRFFDVQSETGFSETWPEVFHGKTSFYIALQLAVMCGFEYVANGELEINIAGVDLAVLTDSNGCTITHHYGKAPVIHTCFTRMLQSVRYGLNYLNERGIKWVNHSPLLASRIEDLQ